MFLAVGLTLCAVTVLTFLAARADVHRHTAQTRANVQAVADSLDTATEQALAAHGAITQSLAASVDDTGVVDPAAFRRLAVRLLAVRDGIKALELAPNGIIEYVHPLVGNGAAVGLDLNRHPSGHLAMEALHGGAEIIVEGPIDLAQGGRGLVLRARVDIADADRTAPPHLWGTAINVIDVDVLLGQAGFDDRPEVRWALHRGAGAVAVDDLILGVDMSDAAPLTNQIDIPGGTWTLSVAPVDGWPTTSPNMWLLIGAGLTMGAVLALSIARAMSEPARLRKDVADASAELRRSNHQTQAIMNSAADAIVAVDDHGSVVASNPATCQLLRLSPEALANVRLPDHVNLDAILLQPGPDGSRIGRATMSVARADGSNFPAEVSLAANHGSGIRTVIIRDVSEAHQREADLRGHVLELERLREEHHAIDAVKRDFMAMASHEVRTPITAIRGFALTLNRHWDQLEEEDRRRSLDVIQRQATRLWHVVSDVLTTSELEGGTVGSRIAPVHLRSTIDEAIADAQVPPNSVSVDCAPNLTARLDPAQLKRILVALLSNAQKYGASPYQVNTNVDGADLVVRVVDHGDGVPLPFRSQLFEPFSQASTGVTREAVGTGLGLSVARGLARAAGGDVWHEERHDVGAVFAVRLPRALDRPVEEMASRMHGEPSDLTPAPPPLVV